MLSRPLGEVLQHRSPAHAPAHEVHGLKRQRIDEGSYEQHRLACASGHREHGHGRDVRGTLRLRQHASRVVATPPAGETGTPLVPA